MKNLFYAAGTLFFLVAIVVLLRSPAFAQADSAEGKRLVSVQAIPTGKGFDYIFATSDGTLYLKKGMAVGYEVSRQPTQSLGPLLLEGY